MSGLELTWKGGTGGPPLDLRPVTLEALRDSGPGGIARLHLQHGNRRVPLGDLFGVKALDEPGLIAIQGATDRFDHLGQGMAEGVLRIEGDAGDYLGQDMAGGRIELAGRAGRYVGTGMSGGIIRIGGDAGDFAAAALPGGRLGMKGGALLVAGRLGARAGDRMRRGVVAAGGGAGAYLGARMIGGTFVVAGPCGPHAGFAMRRGSLVLDTPPERLLATFSDGGVHELPWLELLARELRALGVAGTGFLLRRRRLNGCASTGGKGEMLIPG